jgi:hypothetical protein
LYERTNQNLDLLYQWFLANRLSINYDKTVYSIFSPNKMKLNSFRLYINNIEINRVEYCKCLGVILDEELSWKHHIDYIETKLTKFTSFFYKIRQKLKPDCLKELYFALIYPQLTYAVELYGNAADSNIHKLQILQNKLLRILQFEGRRCPLQKLYINYNTHKIHDLHEINLLCLCHKIINHPLELPNIYQNYLLHHYNIHSHDTRHKNDIFPHHVTTNYGIKDFRFKSHQLWNKLPEEIKKIGSISEFRNTIKKFYLL